MFSLSKKILFIVLIIFTLQILFAGAVLAAEKPQIKLQVPIPGAGWDDSEKEYPIDIADYIGAIYNYAISIVSIIAVIMIAVGGVIWLTAGGSPDRVKTAKDYISSSLIGLFLALGSWVILNTINPNLLVLKVPEIRVIEGLEMVCCQITPGVTDVSEITVAQQAIGIVKRVEKCLDGEKQVACPIGKGIRGFEDVCDPKKPESCPEGQKCIADAAGMGNGLCSSGGKGSPCKTNEDCADPFKCIEEANQRKGIGSCEVEGALSAGSNCSADSQCESKICEANICSSGREGAPCNLNKKCAPGYKCDFFKNAYSCVATGQESECEYDPINHQWIIACPPGYTCVDMDVHTNKGTCKAP